LSWDGRPCSDAWGYNEHTNKSWKERGDRLREDLKEWEELGGSREQWFADRGLYDERENRGR
jgi:hypothetical protein